MISVLLLQIVAAPAPPAAAFLSGRVECRVVDSATNVSNLSFDHGATSIRIVEGGGLARNGASAKPKVAAGDVGPLKMRQTTFEDDSSGVRRTFELAEMIGTGYRANRMVVLSQSGGMRDAGDGMVMAMSQLTAIGMCKAAPQQERR
jgi:hypothetical protein